MALIRVNRPDLYNALKKITPAPKSDKEGYSRSISFRVRSKEKELEIFSKNMNYRFTGVIPIVNKSDETVDSFCFEMLPFFRFLSKIKDDDITFHFEGSKIQIKIMSGVINFENYKRMVGNIIDEQFWKSKYSIFHEGKSKDLLDVMNIATKTSGMSINPEYKRCAIKNNKAYFWYGNVVLVVDSVNVPDFCFRFADIPAIKKVLTDTEDIKLSMASRDYIITSDNNFSITTPFCRFDNVVNACTSVVEESVASFEVPYDTFKQVMGVTASTCGQFDIINLISKFTKDLRHNVFVESSAKTGRNMSYPLIGGYEGIEISLKFTVDFIRQLLSLFESCNKSMFDTVRISCDSKKRVYFRFSNVVAVIGAM